VSGPISQYARGRVAIDLDGVLTNGVTREPLPGAVEAVRSLSERYAVVIFTQRSAEAELFVAEQGLGGFVAEVTDRKPRCWLYIDDRGLRFESWDQALADIERLEVAA
jgi:beta-phosphoglucomutase-like phosphatase (HAD superfamily)